MQQLLPGNAAAAPLTLSQGTAGVDAPRPCSLPHLNSNIFEEGHNFILGPCCLAAPVTQQQPEVQRSQVWCRTIGPHFD